MKRENVMNEIAKLIEVDRSVLNDEFNLKGNCMDSIVIVSMLAIIDINFGVRVQGAEIEACETLGDIFKLIDSKNKSNFNTNQITSIN
jgi:acyl carrier protein